VLTDQLDHLPRNVRQTTRVPVGIYRGLRFGMVLHPQFPPEVYLEGATTRHDTLSRHHHGPRAVLNALDRLASAYASECVHVRQDLSIAESQLRDNQARLGKPFIHDAYLSQLTGLRDQMKAGLSATAQWQGDQAVPSVAELAEKIRALKAAQRIEVTPARVRQKHSFAEDPITARIRRRQEPVFVAAQGVEQDGTSGAGATLLAGAGDNSAGKPPMTFHDRIEMERRRTD
jgi:hypothetical protein